jgi:hypothetical protein
VVKGVRENDRFDRPNRVDDGLGLQEANDGLWFERGNDGMGMDG